ncbi:MAG: hypothetical protein JWN23_2082 [Rhodocyclales bacterium]|nr:hypothetical protein [Rhodocyclales bacterium]
MRTQQSGFTLVEIAIVLVIIGLLLGGVLKGQELINSAKSKAVVSDFRNTATMIAAYQDRFRALPGDDKSASTHLPGGILVAADDIGNGNGTIDGAWNEIDGAKESARAWQHLRLANLASGSTAAPSVGDWEPKDAEGGRIGIQGTKPKGYTVGRLFVCQGNISGRIAQQTDTTMDDGKPNDGSVRVYPNQAAVNDLSAVDAIAVTLDESTLYVICTSF